MRGHNCWLNFRDSVWSSCLSHVHKRFSKTVSFVQKSLFSDSTVHAHCKSVTQCRFSTQVFSTFPPSPDHSETSFGTLSSRPKRCRSSFTNHRTLIFLTIFRPARLLPLPLGFASPDLLTDWFVSTDSVLLFIV